MAQQAAPPVKIPVDPGTAKQVEPEQSSSSLKKELAGMDFAAGEKALAPPGGGAPKGPPKTYGGGGGGGGG